jgi:hypothetical protein
MAPRDLTGEPSIRDLTRVRLKCSKVPPGQMLTMMVGWEGRARPESIKLGIGDTELSPCWAVSQVLVT